MMYNFVLLTSAGEAAGGALAFGVVLAGGVLPMAVGVTLTLGGPRGGAGGGVPAGGAS